MKFGLLLKKTYLSEGLSALESLTGKHFGCRGCRRSIGEIEGEKEVLLSRNEVELGERKETLRIPKGMTQFPDFPRC